jgi:hypothetical protein
MTPLGEYIAIEMTTPTAPTNEPSSGSVWLSDFVETGDMPEAEVEYRADDFVCILPDTLSHLYI